MCIWDKCCYSSRSERFLFFFIFICLKCLNSSVFISLVSYVFVCIVNYSFIAGRRNQNFECNGGKRRTSHDLHTPKNECVRHEKSGPIRNFLVKSHFWLGPIWPSYQYFIAITTENQLDTIQVALV